MSRAVRTNEPTAEFRRLFFFLVDATDLFTPETGEAGGQPEISVNGGAWASTGAGVLVAIGGGYYYAEVTQAAVNIAIGSAILGRYKSANTAEARSDTMVVVHASAFDPWLNAAGYTAPDNSGIAAIQAKTDALPDDPASDASVTAELAAVELAIRGADGDTLKTLSDQLDLVEPPSGLWQVDISVVDAGSAPISGVSVAIYNESGSTLIGRGTTSPSGVASFALDDATYTVRLARAGFSFAAPPALVIAGDMAVEFEGAAWVPTPPSSPGRCVLFDWLADASGEPIAGATIEIAAVVPGSAEDKILGEDVVTATSGEDGYVEIELLRGARVNLMAPILGWEDTKKTVPDADSQVLSEW
jgi:hypothetical protein